MPDYNEGREAKEKFERSMKTLFQTPKLTTRKTKKADTPSLRKKSRPDKN
jgi:hypothetical protein